MMAASDFVDSKEVVMPVGKRDTDGVVMVAMAVGRTTRRGGGGGDCSDRRGH